MRNNKLEQISIAYSIITFILLLIMFLSGLLVKTYGIRVNYTRKINHFSWFFIPIITFMLCSIVNKTEQIIISLASIATIFILVTEFCRNKSIFLEICFFSIDRPEDRPKTLLWLITQTIAGYCVLALFYALFYYFSMPLHLLYLTILSVTIGDGLAEPIGITYGKRKYNVQGFFDSRAYHRSIEGSSVVYFSSLILSILFMDFFSTTTFILLLLFFPLIITLTEAKSPHTWDTPFLFFVGNMVVLTLKFIDSYFIEI